MSFVSILLSTIAIYISIVGSVSISRYIRLYPKYSELRKQEQRILNKLYHVSGRNFIVKKEDFNDILSEHTAGDTSKENTINRLSTKGWINDADDHKCLPDDVGRFLRDQHDNRSYTVLMW